MIKLIIIGYGKMGHLVEEMAADQGFTVVERIDPSLGNELTAEIAAAGEMAIEFTEPQAGYANIKRCVELGLPVVSGTTGWHDKLPQLRELVDKKQGAVVYGSNFSPGMNIFYELVRDAAQIMNEFAAYDVYGYELHHRYKKDSPSGTARELSKILLEELDCKTEAVFCDLQRPKAAEELHFASVRAGEIPGEHRVGFDSAFDTIELRHTARNRHGLAAGAFMAARWLLNRKGLYSFGEIIREQIG